VEIEDEAISPYTIHLQTYTYNELFREPVVQKLGPAKAMFPLNAFLGRLLLFQGYLHSNHAPEMQVVLKKTADGEVLNVVGRPSEETRAAIRRLVRKLFGLAGKTGLYPLFPMLQVGKPGRGFHSGGTFPMSETPGETTADIYGRPSGLRRIHAVDSTIFPSVPATTITFTVMANAWRIGSQLEQYA
jgi:choline dehydrogenase-like flavoprotein